MDRSDVPWGLLSTDTIVQRRGNVWMAWQFNMPEEGKGMVQAFQAGGQSACVKSA